MDTSFGSFVRGLPKAELHLHIEGTLEPEMMFDLAARNAITLPYETVAEVKAAYEFTNLQSFLDIYYRGASVLQTEDDFHDLMWAYLQRAAADGVRRAEMFFDPQIHTERGLDYDVFMRGFHRAQQSAVDRFGISSALILCFLRHQPPQAAVATLTAAMPHREQILAVGLDSSEVGNPPELFADAYRIAREAGMRAVAHAGEEGPSDYIAGALDILGAERIDHGVRCEDDDALVDRLVADQVPLTMCPLSNVELRVVADLGSHNLKRLLDRGVKATVNSDDPAYFGGYVVDNYLAVAAALDLSHDYMYRLARNSLEASFLSEREKVALVDELDAYVAEWDWPSAD